RLGCMIVLASCGTNPFSERRRSSDGGYDDRRRSREVDLRGCCLRPAGEGYREPPTLSGSDDALLCPKGKIDRGFRGLRHRPLLGPPTPVPRPPSHPPAAPCRPPLRPPQ